MGSDDKGFYVNEVFPNTPASKAGMQDGDYIIAVEDIPTKGKTIDELIAGITGPAGSNVKITIERESQKITLAMDRQDIHIPALTKRFFDKLAKSFLSIKCSNRETC